MRGEVNVKKLVPAVFCARTYAVPVMTQCCNRRADTALRHDRALAPVNMGEFTWESAGAQAAELIESAAKVRGTRALGRFACR